MLSGTPTTGNTVTVTTKYAPLTGGQEVVTYTVLNTDTLSSIASSLSGLINADANLKAAGVTSAVVGTTTGILSSSEGFVVSPDLAASVNGVQVSAVDGGNNTTSNTHQIAIPAATTYKASTSGGATETFTLASAANGSTTVTIGGTVTIGDLLTVTISSPIFAQGSVPASYTVASGDTLTSIASGLTAAINNLLAGPVASSSAAVITLQCMAGPTLKYDANGNLLSDGVNAYSWDAENRLIQITYLGGANSQFAYDGFGHLVKIVESTGSTKQFIWSGTIRLEARDNSGSLVSQYFANSQTIGGSNYFYFKDHLGSVREMADGSGNLQAQYEYDPYGRSYKVLGGLNSDMQYAGYYFHAASGQSLAGVRAYNSSLGRWTSRDQIEEVGGLNLYAYVNNAPINLLDSTGTLPFSPGGPPARFGHDIGIDPYFIVRNGCIGIVQALQGQKPGSGPNGGGTSPEKYGDTHCFRTKKEAEDYKCCNGQPPKVIFAKQGKWANGTGPQPVPLPGNEIAPGSVADNGGSFNYVVDDPGPPQQYIWANGAACYVKYQQVFVSPYPPGGQQADAEEWCTTCK